ncbi:MAG: aminopeptidase N [Alphaproteobacteria bacterium]|nr:aminopeptidase N [Alphaproteobacteria bacterium]
MPAQNPYLFNPERNPLDRSDYRPTEYKIPSMHMHLNLDREKTVVSSTLYVNRNPEMADAGGALVLDGENLKLSQLKIQEDGDWRWRDMDRQEYTVTDKHLIIKNPPKGPFALGIQTEINPEANTALKGIYMAGDILCSQCEAQGFRHITYFLDRPDNLAKFTVTMEADKKEFPVLLSNGNGDYKKTQDLGNGRHAITWNDPWPKPSYLFATVAGDMKVLEDEFTTMSGKKVDLRIAVQPGYEDKIGWAMESIKRAMKWDEEKYGREYDLDVFHVVAVDKFNAGAMENKGLNVFNVSYLVGDQETSTDSELIDIEAVIGHEYFHNWTGDRVTLRDWFELTLKEGLTVLRDRQFTEDMHSQPIKRIDDAMELRAGQFMEDSSPAAHPIRPDIVEEFDNIYSSTVYTKGSHVLGMLKTIVGDDTWRKGMDEYFDRFDGQAVTCDDFVNVHEEVSGKNLDQFRRWYSQSGTPEITYEGEYDANAKKYILTLTQHTPATADQPESEKKPLHIPVAVGLIGESGKDAVPTTVLHLMQKKQSFVFDNVDGPVAPSVLRGFSAPVKVKTQPSDDELIFRMAHDSDPFNKYEATERLMVKTIQNLVEDYKNGKELELPQAFMDAYAQNLSTALDGDKAFAARTLMLPLYNIITQDMPTIDPDAVDAALKFTRNTLTKTFERELQNIYVQTAPPMGEKYDVVPEQVGRRELRNTALSYLTRLETPRAVTAAKRQYAAATNMTERYAALANLSRIDVPEAKAAMDDFYTRYKDNSNLVDTWLGLSAGIPHGDTAGRVKKLMQHPAFDKTNPNRVRAVVGGYLGNPVRFHNKDGSGYKFLADTVIEMNDINPPIAAGLSRRLAQFKRYDADRQALMIREMERIMKTPKLAKGVKEVIGKALDTAKTPDAAAPKLDTPKNG